MFDNGQQVFAALERETHRRRLPRLDHLPRARRKVSRNGWIMVTAWLTDLQGNTEADEVAVQLFDTIVLRVDRHGVITLDTDGWRTATTSNWINRYLPSPVQVCGTDATMRISLDGHRSLATREVALVDGMTLWQDGNGRWQVTPEQLVSPPAEVQLRRMSQQWARRARTLPWLIGRECEDCAAGPTLAHLATHSRQWGAGYDPDLLGRALRAQHITAPPEMVDPDVVTRALLAHVKTLEVS